MASWVLPRTAWVFHKRVTSALRSVRAWTSSRNREAVRVETGRPTQMAHGGLRRTTSPGSEVVFTLRRQAEMSDAAFERDAGMVAADLARLKEPMESA